MWGTRKKASDDVKNRRFEEALLPHLNAAYNLARWLTRRPDDADDVVQEAYTRAFTFFDGFHGGDARAWLLTIVRNTCYTWLQRRRAEEHRMEVDEDLLERETAFRLNPCEDPELLVLRRADRELVERALEQLPVEFREAIVLRELEDLSYKEIAAIAGIPMGTVMSRLARGRKLLSEIVIKMDSHG